MRQLGGPLACVECGGPLQWRCPTCRIAQSAAVADADMTSDELMKLVTRYTEACDDLGADLFNQTAAETEAKHAKATELWTQIGAEVKRLHDAASELRWMCAELGTVPRWWTCKTHGDAATRNAWGCPDCVRELREENARLRIALDAIAEHTGSDDPCRSLSSSEGGFRGEAWGQLQGASSKPSKTMKSDR
jgi:hypothetical protein